MTIPMCSTCGTEFPQGPQPASCPICVDERQFVNPAGQQWTSQAALSRGHRNSFKEKEPGLIAIGLEPAFAIGQRALLIQTPHGNVLWDCVPLIDAATRKIVEGLGGLKAIAISHPHFYSAMVSWSEAFGGVPIHLHEADRQWVMRPHDAVRFWSGDTLEILPGLTAIRCGGHFAGGTVLHWADGADGRGALLTGDIVQATLDSRWVSFMRSFPIHIPLSAGVVERIVRRVEPYAFDRIYGAFWGRMVPTDAKGALARSAARYVEGVSGRGPADGEE
jgi:hypothetical protein